jgi:hypothetical protein
MACSVKSTGTTLPFTFFINYVQMRNVEMIVNDEASGAGRSGHGLF